MAERLITPEAAQQIAEAAIRVDRLEVELLEHERHGAYMAAREVRSCLDRERARLADLIAETEGGAQ